MFFEVFNVLLLGRVGLYTVFMVFPLPKPCSKPWPIICSQTCRKFGFFFLIVFHCFYPLKASYNTFQLHPCIETRKEQELKTHLRPRLIKDPNNVKQNTIVLQYRLDKVSSNHWFYSIGPKKY